MEDVAWWARKLEPLEPQRVRRWLQAYQGADLELRLLLDRQIMAEAQKYFPNPRNSPILSLPPQNVIRGPLNLGTVVYDKAYGTAGLHPGELLQNLGIWGRAGAGKTTLILHLLLQLEQRGIPWLFVDVKRTARHLLTQFRGAVRVFTPGRALAPLRFNIFLPPPGLEAKTHITHIVDGLAEAYTLGEGARRMLQKALATCLEEGRPAPSVADVIRGLEAIPLKAYWTTTKPPFMRRL